MTQVHAFTYQHAVGHIDTICAVSKRACERHRDQKWEKLEV